MTGKVFISCGQRDSERQVALEIKRVLEEEFNLTGYLAFKTQSLNDVMTIIEELESSDYYLFIDFYREVNEQNPLAVSLFTQQELSLAYKLGFDHFIAFKHDNSPLEGFLKYLLTNPENFSTEADLIQKIRQQVKTREWSSSYSRNLVVDKIECFNPNVPLLFADHTGSFPQYIWIARVRNHRMNIAAHGTVCILDCIEYSDGSEMPSIDRSYLKWAHQRGFERTILPDDFGDIDLFSMHADSGCIYLHSALDRIPREPIIRDEGEYRLFFKLYSQNFPLVRFSVKLVI